MDICAIGEESPMHLAGATIHELVHLSSGTVPGPVGYEMNCAESLRRKLYHFLAFGSLRI
jgi:hypothetical protein